MRLLIPIDIGSIADVVACIALIAMFLAIVAVWVHHTLWTFHQTSGTSLRESIQAIRQNQPVCPKCFSTHPCIDYSHLLSHRYACSCGHTWN